MAANADDVNRNKQIYKDVIDFHKNALDDLVTVNSLLTFAVFVGLTLPDSYSVEPGSHCKAPEEDVRGLIFSEVVSFALFMLSSLVAKAVKIYLSAYIFSDLDSINRLWNKLVRGSMLILSASCSFGGCIFLTISIMYIVELRLGKLSCGQYALATAGELTTIVFIGIVFYILFISYAIKKSTGLFEKRA